MLRLLVVGISSLLGQYVVHEATARGHCVWATYYSDQAGVEGARLVRADLKDENTLRSAFEEARPDGVVICAALTAVDYCEDHPAEAARVNANGPAYLARLCRAFGTRLVYTSTDYVFDGENGPYSEESVPRPLSVYGRTKWQGEIEVLGALSEAVVVRLCALYGWNRARGKANSVTWILDKLRRGELVPLFTDQWVSPSYAGEVAPILLELLESRARGVFHITPQDCVTRFELGQQICDVFEMDRSLLQGTTLEEKGLRARRPRHSCLTSTRLRKVLNRSVLPLQEALTHMRDEE